MSTKLYYKDSYIHTFTSHTLKQEKDENGQLYIVLEETAFYPTGGGQPYDLGTINGIDVVKVEEINGEIRHYITEELTEHEVTGQLDWSRRFDHMQQHTGQHILSAAFIERFNIPTVAFHLGREIVTIDLATPQLSEEVATEAEQLANQIVFENRPITIRWVDEQEAATLPLRKEPTVRDHIRVVIIEDFDYNGCGGTHPKRTGEVGTIQILGWERHKGNIRLTFVCGWRAIARMKRNQDLVQHVAKQLHSKEDEIPNKVQQLLSSQKESEKALQIANEKLLFIEASKYVKEAKQTQFGKQIMANFMDRSIQEIAMLSSVITEQNEDVIVCFVTKNNENLQCICACGHAIEQNMNALLKAALPLIEGKGGGNQKSARGGGKALVSSEEFLAHLIHILENAQEA
ncbi:DHHA1 domain-containing protein [Microbacteriaceae bacterium 4G12]